MRGTRLPATVIRAGWLIVLVALVLVVGFWASHIAGALSTSGDREALPSPTPVLSIPTVVTEYSDSAPMSRAQLCAEIAPGTNEVLVESNLGAVIETIKC